MMIYKALTQDDDSRQTLKASLLQMDMDNAPQGGSTCRLSLMDSAALASIVYIDN